MMKELQTLRVRIRVLQDERATLTAQTRSRSEVEAHVKRCVAGWARDAQETTRRGLLALAYGNASLMRAEVIAGHTLMPSEADLGPLMVAMLGADKVAGVLLVDLQSVPEGVPKAERLARLEAIEAELFDLEIQEEALIVQSEAEGTPVPRRPAARPAIVLGTPDAPEPRAAQPDEPYRNDVVGWMGVASPYVGSSRP